MKDGSDLTLIKEISYGNAEALSSVMDRYLDLVSRTSFRILCDREGSEYVTVKVFESLWHDVLEYDDSITLDMWLLRRTWIYSRIRIARRRILRIFGVNVDVFVNASPKAEDQDDYVTKQAWELYCRANMNMTPLQGVSYALVVLEELSHQEAAKITGMTVFRTEAAVRRAEEKIRHELKRYGKEEDYDRYNGFLRKVAEAMTDRKKLRNKVFAHLGLNI